MKRILIVDDKESSRWALKMILDDEEYEVSVASSGKEAIQNLEKNQYDLVITDFTMPEMNGMELIRYIRSNFPGIKTALISCGDIKTLKDVAVEAGAMFCIDKLNLQDFIKCVEEIFGKRDN